MPSKENNGGEASAYLPGMMANEKHFRDGWTPLYLAAIRVSRRPANHNLAVAKLLLTNRADPNAKRKDGKTLLDQWPELAEIVKKLEALRLRSGQAEKAGRKQPAQPKVARP